MAVTLYTRTDCSFSVALRRRLDDDGTRYTEIDVAAQPRVIPELLKLTGGRRIVPVLVEGARVQVAPEGGTRF